MEKEQVVVCLYVFIQKDQKDAIDAMVGEMHGFAQEADLAFDNYAVSIETLEGEDV